MSVDVASNQGVWDVGEAREYCRDVGVFSFKICGGGSLWNVEFCNY